MTDHAFIQVAWMKVHATNDINCDFLVNMRLALVVWMRLPTL